jgi:hypothetical protein
MRIAAAIGSSLHEQAVIVSLTFTAGCGLEARYCRFEPTGALLLTALLFRHFMPVLWRAAREQKFIKY